MNKLQINVNDIKSVAKILKKELANMNFELSHSSALNLASRSLGFKNYQAYKGLLEKKDIKKFTFSRPLSELMKEVDEKKLEEYPNIYDRFVKMGHTAKYNIYIERELSEYEHYYFLIFELKNSYTGRVFFTPKYDTFSLYVYPEVKEANSSYDYKIQQDFFLMIKHINQKSWMTKELLDDLMDLMENVKQDRKALIEISNKHSKEELEQRYRGQKND